MNKQQIIKRMNPVQLAKLTGPKTEVADTPSFNLVSEVLTRPDYGGVPAEMSESIEAKQARGVVTIDMAEMPDDTTAEEFITQRVEQAKLGFIDFQQTPPEFIDGTKVNRIDGPLTNVVGKMTGPNEYTYEGPIEELVELKMRMKEEAAEWEGSVTLKEAKPTVHHKSKKKKRR